MSKKKSSKKILFSIIIVAIVIIIISLIFAVISGIKSKKQAHFYNASQNKRQVWLYSAPSQTRNNSNTSSSTQKTNKLKANDTIYQIVVTKGNKAKVLNMVSNLRTNNTNNNANTLTLKKASHMSNNQLINLGEKKNRQFYSNALAQDLYSMRKIPNKSIGSEKKALVNSLMKMNKTSQGKKLGLNFKNDQEAQKVATNLVNIYNHTSSVVNSSSFKQKLDYQNPSFKKMNLKKPSTKQAKKASSYYRRPAKQLKKGKAEIITNLNVISEFPVKIQYKNGSANYMSNFEDLKARRDIYSGKINSKYYKKHSKILPRKFDKTTLWLTPNKNIKLAKKHFNSYKILNGAPNTQTYLVKKATHKDNKTHLDY